MKRRMYDSGERKPDANTLLLLHAEDFIDSSEYSRNIVANSTAINNDGKFGKCFYFNGKGIKLTAPAPPFNFGSGNFTIDFWYKQISVGVDNVIVNTNTPGTWRYGYQLTTAGTGEEGLQFVFADKPTILKLPVSYFKLRSDFNHIAFVRNGAILFAFLNGVKLSQVNITSIPNSIESYMTIGSHTNGTGGSDCFIDEFRVSNIARWTSNFTPPTKPY